MSIKRSSAVWDHSNHKGSALLALLSMADRADDDGYCWPSHEDIAKRARIKRTYVASNIIPDLIKSGEIYQHKRRGKSDYYLVLVGLSDDQIATAMKKRFGYADDRIEKELATIGANRVLGSSAGDDAGEKPKPPRKKSQAIKDLEFLEKKFCELRGCTMPDWKSNGAGNQKNWRSPLRALLRECENDVAFALEVMNLEIELYKRSAKDPRFPMVVPRSFEKRFTSRAIEIKTSKKANGNGNGHNLTQWERMVLANNGRVFDFIRPHLTGETKIEKWIIENPSENRIPQNLMQ